MKKMMILAMMMVMTISATAMNYSTAKKEALFLSDKMAYELNLSAAQYEDVYEINLDYLMSLNGRNDAFGIWWDRRNADLRYVLTSRQYDKYVHLSHFYRPASWESGKWTLAVYSHYDRGRFYNNRPMAFVNYKGGNNHKHDHFYADRHGHTNSSHNSSNYSDMSHGSSKNNTWRNTSHSNTSVNNGRDNSTSHHHMAQADNTSRNDIGQFGGRR